MLLTLTAEAGGNWSDASDLGYLLHKHPDRVQEFDLSVGSATVLYPEVGEQRCTVALMLDVDPIDLARSRMRRGRDGFALGQYVNDRPYAASSMLAVALGRVFGTALAGTCRSHPELTDRPARLTIRVPVLPSRGGPDLPARLFGPLGWAVTAESIPLDGELPEWGASEYVDLTMTATLTVSEALRHLYVLLPVLDDVKHYWVGREETEKLVRTAGEWLPGHPESELIGARYLAHQRELVQSLADLLSDDTDAPRGDDARSRDPRLADLRADAVLAVLAEAGAARVVDVGCGDGRLLRELAARPQFTRIVGVDVSDGELQRARRRLRADEFSDAQRERLSLLHSSVVYRDSRLAGFDAAVLMEVIEHVDPPRLPALERSVFGEMRPRTVVVTTPNSEYNPLYPTLAPGAFRHPDHRFEFDRDQFREWAETIASTYGYTVGFAPVGPLDESVGAPTQLAVFTREGAKK
ncbi:3' terminal RNA ribose 2'-O-methyltransferase Hen1 [Prescottella agglutinans]|uniref:Small RNA 2'-O-methyltransferase n=1 Tax=Prescottella agglutinans TaxID=1644129 RepID=A0A3S3CZZ9_9NOCA|nr:3' terminal RNA ribose 2'-O-methyltransferase Hen1 [Prescottella agglutinans]RVW09810.1 3' terminal RNA ribose 2'-O-methyltransferase Hen1 [Prescottella agglutinans]